MDFKDKVIIITGASSGIGAVTAQYFAKLSAKVVIVGRNEEKLNNIAKIVENTKSIKPLVVKADVTNDNEVKTIVEETIKHFGKIDVLVNNAGAGVKARLQQGIAPFDKMIITNLRSVYLLTSLAAPYLIKTKGNIINVSSIASVRVAPDFTCYCISKAALDMFTKCIAKDLGAQGVRVNSVNPGPVKTNFQSTMGLDEKMVDDYFNLREARTALGHLATSEDVSELITFLASDKARSITGSIYFVESGDLLA